MLCAMLYTNSLDLPCIEIITIRHTLETEPHLPVFLFTVSSYVGFV